MQVFKLHPSSAAEEIEFNKLKSLNMLKLFNLWDEIFYGQNSFHFSVYTFQFSFQFNIEFNKMKSVNAEPNLFLTFRNVYNFFREDSQKIYLLNIFSATAS